MLEAVPIVPEEQRLLLSSLSPGPAQKRLALSVVLGIVVVFVLITVGLLSGVQTKRIDAFLPAYLSAMFVCDSITAVLLFAQFSILRTRAILVIASAYLFTALILIPYVLTFPGVFVPRHWLEGCRVRDGSTFCGIVVFLCLSSATPFQKARVPAIVFRRAPRVRR